MFAFLKKKPESSRSDSDLILSLPEDRFFLFLSTLIRESDPNSQVMRVIAYQNLEVNMKVTVEIAKNDPSLGAPVSIEDHIRYYDRLKTENKENEFAVRRLLWFFQASLMKRAEALGLGRSQYDDLLAEIWITVAEGCYCLANVVQNNILWSDDEKIWYSEVKSEKDGIAYCLNLIAPQEIRHMEKVKKFAISKGIYLFTDDREDMHNVSETLQSSMDEQIAALEKEVQDLDRQINQTEQPSKTDKVNIDNKATLTCGVISDKMDERILDSAKDNKTVTSKSEPIRRKPPRIVDKNPMPPCDQLQQQQILSPKSTKN